MKYVAFDLGASSGKLFEGKLIDGKIQIRPIHRFHNAMVRLGDGLYWDFMSIYSNLVRGLQIAEADGKVDSVGIDSFNNDFSLVGADGSLLMPIRAYRDQRTRIYWRQIFSLMPQERIYSLSGNQIAPFNTLMQLAAMNLSGQGILIQTADKLLMLPDLLGFYITGKSGIEYTLAAETELMDLSSRTWIQEILDTYQIPRALLPTLRLPATILGSSTDTFNQEHGLSGFDFVSVCEHDTASAFLSSPVGGDSLIISSGTWALIGVELNAPVISAFTYRNNLANEGSMDGHHRLLRNVMGSWIVQELKKELALLGREYTFEQITRIAGEAKPFQHPIDPDDPIFYQPGDMVEKIVQVSNRNTGTAPQTDGELFRCVYEALAMKYRFCAEMLEKAVGRHYDVVNVLGGGCQDKLSNQMIANACGRRVIAGPIEASSIGNLLVQMIAHGEVMDIEEGRKIIWRSFAFEAYEPTAQCVWEEHYPDYCRCFQTGASANLSDQ